MSNRVSAMVERRRVGSATRKAILLMMADKASDDGSGIWISQGTIAARLELTKRAVQKNTQTLIEEGLICAVGKKRIKYGYTVDYKINLSAVTALPNVEEWTDETNSPVNEVHRSSEPSSPDGVNEVHPNHPTTILEPPTRKDAQVEEDSEFDVIWSAFPNDRHRNKATCLDHFRRAVSDGAEPNHILAAVRAYAAETAGHTRSKVCFADNWFRETRWERHVTANAVADPTKAAEVASRYKRAIIANNPELARHCPTDVARSLIAAGEVSIEQCKAAGVSV